MKRVVLGSVLTGVALLAFLSSWAERRLAPALTDVGVELGQVIAPSVGHAPPHDDKIWDTVEESVLPSERSVKRDEPAKRGAPARRGAERPEATVEPLPSLFVSAEQVLRLSRTARIPAGRYVAAAGRRPSGLQVAGVGGLGIGVKDGDVLTRVAGAAIQSPAAVVSSVLQLRAKHVGAISAEVWRGERPYRITFEMPYLDQPAPSSVGSSAKEAVTRSAVQAGPGSSATDARKAASVVGRKVDRATAD